MRFTTTLISRMTQAFADGEFFDCEGGEIEPSDFRALWLDLQKVAAFDRSIAQVSFQISNARFVKRLDLSDCTSTGGSSQPGLRFRNCKFSGGLDLTGSALSRLELSACQVGTEDELPNIDLTETRLSGSLRLSALARPDQCEVLWVEAHHCRIEGDLVVERTAFVAPAKRSDREILDRKRYALCLDDTVITGSITACPGLVARGGINLKNSTVAKDIWLLGATISAGEGYALNGQAAHIAGCLSCGEISADAPDKRQPFVSFGPIAFLGARLGEIFMSNALLLSSETDDAGALLLGRSQIDRMVQISESTIIGSITIEQARINGSLVIANARVGALPYASAAGRVLRRWFSASQCIVGNDIVFSGVFPLDKFEVPTELIDAADGPGAFNFVKEQTESTLDKSFGSLDEKLFDRFLIADIWLDGAAIGSLKIDSASNAPCLIGAPYCIKADDLQAQSGIRINGRLAGDIDLSQSNIKQGSIEIEGLNILGFRGQTGQVSLRNCDIAKSLQVKNPRRMADASLIAAREVALACMPGKRLIETLWEARLPDGQRRTSMYGYILDQAPGGIHGAVRRYLLPDRHEAMLRKSIIPLTGESRLFHDLNGGGKVQLRDEEQAEEFLRLFTAYVQGEEGAFRIAAGPQELDGVSIPSDVSAKLVEEQLKARENNEEDRVAELQKQIDFLANPPADLGELVSPIAIAPTEQGTFAATAFVLYAKQLFRSEFRIGGTGSELIAMTGDEPVTPQLEYGVEYKGKEISRSDASPYPDGFPLAPTLDGMTPVSEIKNLERLLQYQGPVASNLGAVLIDLRDAHCDTLDDAGGSAWGPDATFRLNRFTYRQSVDEDPDTRDPRGPGRLLTTLGLGRIAARLLPEPVARTWGLGSHESGWETRFFWLMRQYPEAGEFGKVREGKIVKRHYRPQPFEQAIRSAEANGNFRVADELHIRKNWIEGLLRGREMRAQLLVLGLVLAAIYVTFSESTSMVDGLVAAIILVLTWCIADLARLSMRYMFGYLTKPINALASLACFMFVGSLGVSLANASNRLVIDLVPTASVTDGKTIAAPISDRTRKGIRCGDEIDPVLYAVDIFIPLIDMREESKCSVGVVDGTDIVQDTPSSANGVEQPWYVTQATEFERRTIDSTTFWSTAKAIYGLLGWIVISLSILTFTRAMRRPVEM